MKNIRTLTGLRQELKTNPQFLQDFKSDPLNVLEKTTYKTLPNNLVYWIVVASLGLSLIIVGVGSIILCYGSSEVDKCIPTIFTAIISGSIGALAGLLSQAPSQE